MFIYRIHFKLIEYKQCIHQTSKQLGANIGSLYYFCFLCLQSRRNNGVDKRAPTVRPRTRKNTRMEAARP